jgi:hypothetical protein
LAAGCGLIDADVFDVPELSPVTAATRLPERDPALVSTEVAPDRITLTYAGPADGAALAPGHVIVGEQGGGYLRTVERVEASDRQLVVHTQPAAITDAIANARARFAIELPGAGPAAATGAITLVDLTGRVLVDTTVSGVPVRATIVRGTVALEPTLTVELAIARRQVRELGLEVTGTITGSLEIALQIGGAVTLAREVDLSGPAAALLTYPFVFVVPTPIGPLPVAGALELDAIAGIAATATAKGSLTAGVTGEVALALRAEYADGAWAVEGAPAWRATAQPPQRAALVASEVRAYVRPEVRVRLYGVAGPRATVTPALVAAARAAPPPPVTLRACLSGELGFDAAIFGQSIAALSHAFPEACAPLPLP